MSQETAANDDGIDSNTVAIDRRTVLKLTSGAIVASALAATTVSAENHVEAEIEGPLEWVDPEARTIGVMGVALEASAEATIESPTAALSLTDLDRGTFPGRTQDGFIGATVGAEGVPGDGSAVMTADTVFVEWEHVFSGPVTESEFGTRKYETNTEALMEGTFEIQGVRVTAVDDDRFPIEVTHEDLETEVDVTTIPEGSAVTAEGYMGDDGTLYAALIHTEEGDPIDGPTLNIDRAECDPDKPRLRVRGTSSDPDGVVELADTETDEVYGTTDVETDDTGESGEFRFDLDLSDSDTDSCPETVRAEHDNGATATTDVAID